jgi:hypothetical protein
MKGVSEVVATVVLLGIGVTATGSYYVAQEDIMNNVSPEVNQNFNLNSLKIQNCYIAENEGRLLVRNSDESAVNISKMQMFVDDIPVSKDNYSIIGNKELVGSQESLRIGFVPENSDPAVKLSSQGTETEYYCDELDLRPKFSIKSINAPSIDSGATFTGDYVIRNVGLEAGKSNIEYIIEDKDSGKERVEGERTSSSLDTGSKETYSETWGTGSNYGEHVFTVSTEDDMKSKIFNVNQPAYFETSVIESSSFTNLNPLEGDKLKVKVKVKNTGGESGSKIIDYSFGSLKQGDRNINLGVNEKTYLYLDYQTSTGDAGSYSGNINVNGLGEDSNFQFDILEPGSISVTSVGAQSAVEGSDVLVDASLSNTGSASKTDTIELATPLGNSQKEVTLAESENKNIDFSISTSTGDVGSYTAEVCTSDGNCGSDSFEVNSDSEPADFAVSSVTAQDTMEGENIPIDSTVCNNGGLSGSTTLSLEISGLSKSKTENADLGSGVCDNVPFTVSTSTGDVGSYTAEVCTSDGNCASDQFNINEESTTANFQISANDGSSDWSPDTQVDETYGSSVDVNVENTGGVSSCQTVSYDTGFNSDSKNMCINPGNNKDRTFEVTASCGDSGSWNAVAATQNDSMDISVDVSQYPYNGGSEVITQEPDPSNYDQVITSCSGLMSIEDNLGGDYALGSDIDCSGMDYEPIGQHDTSGGSHNPIEEFTGTLNGYGYEIQNINSLASSLEYHDGAGIFSVTKNAEIRNIVLDNINIDETSGSSQLKMVGGLVGSMTGGEVKNIAFKSGEIGPMNYAGGLVGYTWGGANINNVYVGENVNVNAESEDGIGAGGIIGRGSSSSISHAYSKADVYADDSPAEHTRVTYAGGIAGVTYSSSLESTYSTAQLTSTNGDAYAWAGYANDGSITNSYSTNYGPSVAYDGVTLNGNKDLMSLSDMQGCFAFDNMPNLDYENTWWVPDSSSTPRLQAPPEES